MFSASPGARLRACGVRVPCSTSNLGAGFDCIGLAFDRYLDTSFTPGGDTLTLQRGGTLASLDSSTADDLLVTSFVAELRRRGIQDPTGSILAHSSVPVGRGLGSSGAAVVAGMALAAGACGDVLDRRSALGSAARQEGHPDNAAPSLFGGLVAIAYGDHGMPAALRLPLSPGITFVFVAPDFEVTTPRARAALPQHVPHAAATRNLGRVAALMHGLANADPAAIGIGFADELHVPYRLPLIHGARDVISAGRDAGAWGVTISGSGSGLVAACAPADAQRVLDAMRTSFISGGHAADGFIARPDTDGVQPRDPTRVQAQFT